MCRTVLAAVLMLAASMFALDRPDVPGDIHSGPRVASQADRGQSLTETRSTPTPAWSVLEQMNGAERQNSCIQLELPGDASSQARAAAVEVTDLWNCGKYNEALVAFRSIGKLTNPSAIAIGNSWRAPVPTLQTALWGNDVRIGDRDSISLVVLDIHRASGNLFAVLGYPVTTGHYWAVNLSTDGGATWTETFQYYTTYSTRSISASVLTNYLYVAYDGGASPNREARIRRFSAGTGAQALFTGGASYITAYTAAASDSVKEVSLVSNQDYADNRLYYMTLLYGGAIKYCWDDTGAVSWDTTTATGVTNGANALDACTNEGYDSTFLWVSYYDNSDSLHIIGRRGSGFRNLWSKACGSGTHRSTSIGAYHDTLFCAYDFSIAGTGTVVRYNYNYEGANPSSTWYYGFPGRDTTTQSEFADVALRDGGGIGMVYRYYTTTRELRYMWSNYSAVGFGDPVAIGDYEPFWNHPALEYLGSAYGLAYIRWSDSTAYFDRTDWTGIAERRQLVMDMGILNVTPNPLSGYGRLNYTLNRPADLRVQVFDRAGRVVRTLFDGHSASGRQSFGFDAAGMVPGVYFVRADADGRALTVPMTVVK